MNETLKKILKELNDKVHPPYVSYDIVFTEGVSEKPILPPHFEEKLGKYIGSGVYGIVFEYGDKVMKIINSSHEECYDYKYGCQSYELGVGPRYYSVHTVKQSHGGFTHYIVMQKLQGTTLKKSSKRSSKIMYDVLCMIHKLYMAKIPYFDLRGDNIMCDDTRMYLIDYDIPPYHHAESEKKIGEFMLERANGLILSLTYQHRPWWSLSSDEQIRIVSMLKLGRDTWFVDHLGRYP